MKAYIVEDNESMRIILARLLRKNFPSITSVGESETAEEALVEIREFRPYLVLVDISLPGIDGIELIRRLKPHDESLCILVITAHEVDFYRERALRAGAREILSKSDFSELISMIRIILDEKKSEGCV